MGTLVFTFFQYHKITTAHTKAPLVEFTVIQITDLVKVLRIQMKIPNKKPCETQENPQRKQGNFRLNMNISSFKKIQKYIKGHPLNPWGSCSKYMVETNLSGCFASLPMIDSTSCRSNSLNPLR
jgi:hypothetical protein